MPSSALFSTFVIAAASVVLPCALLAGGQVDCWGSNSLGQLGNGTATGPDNCANGFVNGSCSTTPVAVSGITNAVAIAAGFSDTCALLAGGHVDCWGDNQSGELGNAATGGPDCGGFCSATPVAVSGITNAVAIAAGYGHTCALLAGGHVDCWGDNRLGELGDSTTTGVDCGGSCSTAPVAVSGITSAVAITTGASHSCALLSTGSVTCWGSNHYGQLGNDTQTDSDVPVPVNGFP